MRGEPKPVVTSVRRYVADRNTQYRQNPHIDIKPRLSNGQKQAGSISFSLLHEYYIIHIYHINYYFFFLGARTSRVTRAILTDLEPGPSPELHIFGLSTLIDKCVASHLSTREHSAFKSRSL